MMNPATSSETKPDNKSERLARVRQEYLAISPRLNERSRRSWAAAQAKAIGWGGVSLVARATGLSAPRIQRGLRELAQQGATGESIPAQQIRRAGGGDKRLVVKDPMLLPHLDALLEPGPCGDQLSPLRWTCKSTRQLAGELQSLGHKISAQTVAALLRAQGYSLRASQAAKGAPGPSRLDPDRQFESINNLAESFARRGEPVIVVHQLPAPRGAQGGDHAGRVKWPGDADADQEWSDVAIDHDGPQVITAAIRSWWTRVGARRHAGAGALMIAAEDAGSDRMGARGWGTALQDLARELGLAVTVSRLPSGTSKWREIEHRLFCRLTESWRGEVLSRHEVVVTTVANAAAHAATAARAALHRPPHRLPNRLRALGGQLRRARARGRQLHGSIHPRGRASQIGMRQELAELRLVLREAEASQDRETGRRVKAIIDCLNGKTMKAVGAELAITRRSIQRWLQWFREGGAGALRSRKASGPSVRLDAAQLAELTAVIQAGPRAAGLASGRWSRALVVALIGRRYGVRYRNHDVARLLRQSGLAWPNAVGLGQAQALGNYQVRHLYERWERACADEDGAQRLCEEGRLARVDLDRSRAVAEMAWQAYRAARAQVPRLGREVSVSGGGRTADGLSSVPMNVTAPMARPIAPARASAARRFRGEASEPPARRAAARRS
jgi:transposase